MPDTLITVENVSKKFCRDLKKSLWYAVSDIGRDIFKRNHRDDIELRPSEFWANRDISFEVKRGECLGLIGHNGAGKTTLLKMLNGLIKPDSGRIEMRGRVGALIALGAGFNPVLTGRENIYVNGSILGLSRKEIATKLDEIIDFAEIEEAIDAPVRTYSSGMQVRLGFAVASSMQPDILLVDEILAVGDLAFKNKCSQRMQAFRRNGGSIILVSHSIHVIQTNCESTLLLDKGKIITKDITSNTIAEFSNLQFSRHDVSEKKNTFHKNTSSSPIVTKLSAKNSLNEKIFPNDPITLQLHVKATKDLENIYPIFILKKLDGSFVTTLSGHNTTEERSLKKGENCFHLHIKSLPLCPGIYHLTGGIWGETSGHPIATIGYDNNPETLIVHASGNNYDNSHQANGDIIHSSSLALTWGLK